MAMRRVQQAMEIAVASGRFRPPLKE